MHSKKSVDSSNKTSSSATDQSAAARVAPVPVPTPPLAPKTKEKAQAPVSGGKTLSKKSRAKSESKLMKANIRELLQNGDLMGEGGLGGGN